jgi:hypothetical protein
VHLLLFWSLWWYVFASSAYLSHNLDRCRASVLYFFGM